ncbi:hypothetical protein Tco_0143490 [Tanacetum coccineum]
MSTPVFVNPEISTQADGAQSPRVPVPFPEDPYEVIMQAYLVETKTPESPHTVASPTPLPDSTPPTRHAKDSVDFDTSGPAPYVRTVPPAKIPPASLGPKAEVQLLPIHSFHKEVEDDDEEDEEIEESLDSDSKSEDAEDEGPTVEDEDPAAGDEGLPAGDEGPGMRVESLGLGRDAAVPEGQQRSAPVVETTMGQSSGSVPVPERPKRVTTLRQPTLTTWIDLEDGRAYIDVPAYPPPAPPVQTSPSPEWSSGSLPISPEPSIESRAWQERVVVTFGAIWRPVLTLESWTGQTDAQREALWNAISDTQMENQELRLQIAEERRTRLDLAEIVDSMRRRQEPKGDV